MTTAKIDQTPILDLIDQQDPVVRVDFAIGAMITQLEQIEDELEPMTDNIDDMTVKQMGVYDRLTDRVEVLSRVLSHLTVYKDRVKTIRLISVVYSRWTDDGQYPDLEADLRYVVEILTGEIDI